MFGPDKCGGDAKVRKSLHVCMCVLVTSCPGSNVRIYIICTYWEFSLIR